MRSLKKRVVSFVSAIAMAITMLPSASLFASAASADGVTISLKKTSAGDGTDIFTNWNNEYQGKFVDSNTQEYQAGYNNGDYAKARSEYEFDANEAYTFTLDVALQDENAERDMPELQIGGKVYGQFPKATITQAMRDDHSNLPAGYEWKDGYFVYKPTLTVTPTEGGYKSIQLDFKHNDKDKVGFKALSIVKGSTGGNDSSSTGGNDSSSTTDSSEVLIGTLTADGSGSWTKHEIGTFDFTNYTDVRFEMISTNGNEFNKFYVNSSEKYFGNLTSISGKLDGTDYPNVAGQSDVTFYYEGNAIVEVTFYGTRIGGEDPEPTTYTVAATYGEGGTATVDKSTVTEGGTATFTATPNNGYHFVNWTDNNNGNAEVSTNASYTATITEDTSLKANFEADAPTTYTVAATYGEGGTASVDKSEVTAGDTATFTATPDSGYHFVNWTDNNNGNAEVSTNASYTATITENTSLKANFEVDIPTYTVTANSGMGGIASVNKSTVTAGETATFTATPNNGYEFVKWSDDSTENPHTITINADTTLTATFRAVSTPTVTYPQTVNAIVDGQINPEFKIISGDNNKFWADEDMLNTNAGLSAGTRGALPFVIDDTSSDVIYTIKVYLQSNNTNTYACVFGKDGTTDELCDGIRIPTAEQWSITRTDPWVFTLTGDKFTGGPGTYYAGFNATDGGNNTWLNFYRVEVLKSGGEEPEPTTYTVTATYGEGGTASVDKSTVTAGETATFTATPDDGYEFVKWSDDSTENPHTITINADTTLTATFRAVSTPDEEEVIIASTTDTANFGGWGEENAILLDVGDLSEYTSVKLIVEGCGGSIQLGITKPEWKQLYQQDNVSGTLVYPLSEEDMNATRFQLKGSGSTPTSFKVVGVKKPSADGYAVVLPHKNAGKVAKSGNTLTASPNSARDWKFVGWYRDKACTELITTEASTAVSEGNELYAKFDYVSYGMPIFDITTSKNSDSFNAAWGNATKDTKYKGSAITIANTDWELPTIEEEVYYTDAEGNYTDAEGNIVDEENKVVKETIARPMQVEIKGRGNSTWVLDKKPFQIKFEKAVQPFGMGSEKNKTWILLANHADRTLMRNQLAYDWARTALSNLPFVTDTKPVELYINGEYQGVYLLVEKSEAGSKGGRVNIQMAESNTSNIDEIGFLAEWDKLAANKDSEGKPAEDYVVRVSGGGWSELFTIKDGIPECKTKGTDGRPSDATTFDNLGDQSTEVTNTNDTVNAIDKYLSEIAVAIMSGKESDIKTKVDINSLVDMFILQELTKNPDAGGSSFYVYKDMGAGAKLTFSPPWDFDKALGDEIRVTSPYGLYIYGGDDENNNQDNVNTWYKKLYEQDWFKTIVRNRWKELRSNSATDPETIILPFIGDFATTYSSEINRNRDKWYTDATTEYQYSEGGFWGDKGLSGYFADEGKTYDAQKNGLYNWVRDRIRFLDEEWDDSEWVLVDKFASDGFQLGQGNDHELYFDIDELFATYSRVKIVVDGKGYDLRMYLDPESGEGKLAIPHQTLGNPQTSGDQGFEKISYELDQDLDADKIKAVLQAQTDWSWVREFAIYGVEADITEDPLDPQPTFRVNNASYGSLNKQVSTDVYYLLNERITAVAKEGYKFVNWTIVTDNGKNVVPITNVFKDVSETSSRLTITAEMAGKIIYANFGKIQEIKFEAEDFVDFISEGYIVSKGRTGDITEGDKTYHADELAEANDGKGQKISNEAFFGRKWKHPEIADVSESRPYDKPKVVADNGGNETQIWDNSLYTDHNIVKAGYSGGEAVALTGPTSGIAIPFKIAEDLYEPFKFAVGYNYGDLPTHFKSFNNGDNQWSKDSLYVNIYTTAKLTDEQTAALRANGWEMSEYATHDAASDYLLNNAEANGEELQTAFSKPLPVNAANTNGWTGRWMTNNSEEACENVQEVDLSIPAGMPAGQYYISVATDHNNLTRDSARMRLQEKDALLNNDTGDTNNPDYSEGDHTETPGTAYYDYIKFYTASTPDKPSPITVGANFIFKDMFGNSLMTNEFTDASFDAGFITFTPKVPRYLKVQGYKIERWVYTDPDGNPAELRVDQLGEGKLEDDKNPNDDGTWNNNVAFDLLAKELEKLKYKQGTTVTFTAHYTVPDRQYEVTLNNGTMYTWNESTGEFTDLVEPHEIYLVGNYQKIKLVADDSRLGVFSHWELNGQIYSYDPEIFFTAWTNAKFEACYVEEAPELKAATFIDTENIQMYGFTDDTTTAYNKITFNCAFYIPDGVEYVEGGLLYTPDEAKLQDPTIETLVTINELGELQLPADGRIAVSTLRYEQLDHDLNNQVLMSITGTKKGKKRTARTYIIYKQIIDGAPKYTLAFSQKCVTVTAGDENYTSTI